MLNCFFFFYFNAKYVSDALLIRDTCTFLFVFDSTDKPSVDAHFNVKVYASYLNDT